MFTVIFGLRLTLKPFLPWKPVERGWLSLFFVHFFLRLDVARKKLQQVERRSVIADETKRKSLQPGTMSDVRARPPTASQPSQTLITADETKQKSVQPKGDESPLVQVDALKGITLTHKFYGSQLILGSKTLLSGLSVGLHLLEITSDDEFYIDNNAVSIGKTDLIKIKTELSKVVR